MKVLGSKIKDVRERKKMSQQELAEEICPYAVIRIIETKNRCDSLNNFIAICERLEIKFDEYIEYTVEEKVNFFFDEIEEKCNRLEHKEAYELMNNFEIENVNQDIVTMIKYKYYQGITALLGAEDFSTAQVYLYQVMDYGENVNIYSILSINALGASYALTNEMDKAKVYYDKSMVLLEQYTGEMEPIAYKAYYNSAKFYSLLEEYEMSIRICEQAIQLNKKYKTLYYLDLLYYELGFNKYMLNQDGIMEYKISYYLCQVFENKELPKYIIEDSKKYNIPFQVDENGVI